MVKLSPLKTATLKLYPLQAATVELSHWHCLPGPARRIVRRLRWLISSTSSVASGMTPRAAKPAAAKPAAPKSNADFKAMFFQKGENLEEGK